MAKKNDRKNRAPPLSLSQPTFPASPASAVNNPPLSASAPSVSNPNVIEKGKAKATDQRSTTAAERTPQLLNPRNVQPQLQAPVRWVYNYDHTDPHNFGFMFPVSPSSSTDVSSLNTYAVSSTLSPAVPAPPDGSVGDAFLPIEDAPGPSSGGQGRWDLHPAAPEQVQPRFVGRDQQTPPSVSYQAHSHIHQNIPLRYNTDRYVPPATSTQQFTPPEEEIWFLPPHGTTIPEEFQDDAPDSRTWLRDGSSGLSSQSFAAPVSSGSLITQQYTTTALTALKRKRVSETSSSPITPYLSSVADRQESTLCSRCKINEKLSNVPGLCNSCLQVSFNTWPSAMGTRNENLESLVLFLMPSNMEDVLAFAPPNIPRARSWRILSPPNDQKNLNFSTLVFQDRWTLSRQQAESTRLFGEDYAELAKIARLYQLSLPRPNKSLEASCTVLITVCELYKSFVEVTSNPHTISVPKLLNNIRTARITMRHAFQQLQMLAVSPSSSRDRQDWFPAFLSACIMTVAAIIFIDILVACPSPYKEQIWGVSWHDRIVEMRHGGYGMLISLLKSNTKGINPLKMDCWTDEATSTTSTPFINVTPDTYSPEQMSPGSGQGKKRRRTNKVDSEKARQKSIEMEAERERNVLLGINSPEALQGVLALKAWHLKYHENLKQGEDMFSKSLYMLAAMKPVAGLWRIFELE